MSVPLGYPRLVFDFTHPPEQRLEEVKMGIAPRESLLGYIQLEERGWSISSSDDRWNGVTGAIRTRLRRVTEIPSTGMISSWKIADIVIIVTRISLVLAIVAKVLGKKIVFLDAMQEIPKSSWKRLLIKQSLKMADASICYSASQAQYWSRSLGISEDIFIPLKYGVDHEFYKPLLNSQSKQERMPFILSVGRDPQRDFETLISAVDKLDWSLKLVTLDYLVPERIRHNPRVQVLERLDFNDLFNLYSDAAVVVVPVKRSTTYMSGIRATMEAMLLGVPIVASRVSGLEEYFNDEEELIFYEPEDPESLTKAIQRVCEDNEFRQNLVLRARIKIMNSYSVRQYADSLENVLRTL